MMKFRTKQSRAAEGETDSRARELASHIKTSAKSNVDVQMWFFPFVMSSTCLCGLNQGAGLKQITQHKWVND